MRPYLSALAAAFAAVLPCVAAAQIEVHVGAGAFSELVRRRIEANRPCPAPLPDCLGSSNGPCFFDHLETQPGGFLRRTDETVDVQVDDGDPLTMPRLQYLQPIRVYSKTLACIRDPGCADDAYEGQIDLQVMLDVTTNGNKLCLSYAGLTLPVEPGSSASIPLPVSLPQGPAPVCIPVRLKPVERIVGSGPADGVLVAASADLQTLALRLRFPIGVDLPEYVQAIKNGWQSFLSGSLAPGAVSANGWSLFISDGPIEKALEGRFEDALDDSANLELDGDVQATWDPALGSAGGVDVEFYAELSVDLCLNSIGLSPANVVHSFSLDAVHRELVVDGSVSWSVNEADVLLCGMSFAHVDGFVLTSAVVGGGIYAADYEPAPEDIPVPGECVKTGTTTFTCRYSLEMPQLDGAPLQLGAATPLPEGLVISGTVFLGLGGGIPQDEPLAEVYDVTQPGGTTDASLCGPLSHDPYWAKIRFRGTFCDAEVVPGSDPHGVYGLDPTWVPAEPNSGYWNELVVGVIFPTAHALTCGLWIGDPPQALACFMTHLELFWNNPYELLATVWTTDGARTVAVGPPVKSADPKGLDWKALMEKIEEFNRCLFPFIPFDLPTWMIDPPPAFALHLPERGDVGKVVLENLRIFPLNALADPRGQAYERGVWLGLAADAIVMVEGRRYTVPVAAPFQVDWDLKLDERGAVTAFILSRTAGAHVEVGQALPEAYQGAAFDVTFAPGGVVLYDAKR